MSQNLVVVTQFVRDQARDVRHPMHVVAGLLVARGADLGELEDDLLVFALERLAFEQLHVVRQPFHPVERIDQAHAQRQQIAETRA